MISFFFIFFLKASFSFQKSVLPLPGFIFDKRMLPFPGFFWGVGYFIARACNKVTLSHARAIK